LRRLSSLAIALFTFPKRFTNLKETVPSESERRTQGFSKAWEKKKEEEKIKAHQGWWAFNHVKPLAF